VTIFVFCGAIDRRFAKMGQVLMRRIQGMKYFEWEVIMRILARNSWILDHLTEYVCVCKDHKFDPHYNLNKYKIQFICFPFPLALFTSTTYYIGVEQGNVRGEVITKKLI
jgi:hypothetical protein